MPRKRAYVRSGEAMYAAVGPVMDDPLQGVILDTDIVKAYPASRQTAAITDFVARQIAAKKERPFPKGMTMKEYVAMHTAKRDDSGAKYMRRVHRRRETPSEMSGTTSGVGSSRIISLQPSAYSEVTASSRVSSASEGSGTPGYTSQRPSSVIDLVSVSSKSSRKRKSKRPRS